MCEGKQDLDDQEKDYPLNLSEWTIFLSQEIYNEENINSGDKITPMLSLIIVVLLTFINLIYVITSDKNISEYRVETVVSLINAIYILMGILIFYCAFMLYSIIN